MSLSVISQVIFQFQKRDVEDCLVKYLFVFENFFWYQNFKMENPKEKRVKRNPSWDTQRSPSFKVINNYSAIVSLTGPIFHHLTLTSYICRKWGMSDVTIYNGNYCPWKCWSKWEVIFLTCSTCFPYDNCHLPVR